VPIPSELGYAVVPARAERQYFDDEVWSTPQAIGADLDRQRTGHADGVAFDEVFDEIIDDRHWQYLLGIGCIVARFPTDYFRS